MVPSKGLEPPHPCEYMDLNHARLPIPPRWQVDFHCSGDRKIAVSGRPTFLFYRHEATCQTNRAPGFLRDTSCPLWLMFSQPPESPYSSFALIVIFAFRTFDTRHAFSAASAYF